MNFYADEMLGKLARWLRLAGLDVAYERGVEDSVWVEKAKSENRFILTRDMHLIQKLKPEEFLFIGHDHLEDQFSQFHQHFPGIFEKHEAFSRCAECNSILIEVPKEELKGKTFNYVYYTQDRFKTCPNCKHIYWDATHVEKIRNKLRSLIEKK